MSTPEQPDNESSESSESPDKIEMSESTDTKESGDTRQVELTEGELEDLREAFVLAESRRRRRALLGGTLVLVGLAVFFWVMATYGDTNFRPEVEKGEQNVLSETNDPICRGVIEQVTAIGEKYFERESEIERSLGSNDREEVLKIQSFLEKQREELAAVSSTSEGAVLRYDVSRAELNRWFEFVDTEYGQLITLAGERVARLESGGDGEQSAAAKKAEAVSLDLQGRALLAIHESFHSFRVWHSSSLHPCGSSATELMSGEES